MGDYLKLFDTHAKYETYIKGQDVILPNVSYCEDKNCVHYNPWTWAEEYLTFVAKENGTFTFKPYNNNVVSYSTDNGSTWTEGKSIEVNNGDKVMWKGTMTPLEYNGVGTFSSTGNFDAQGNVMSLLFGDNFKGQTDLTGKGYAFYQLFYQNTKVINAENLSLPAETLANSCYGYMFVGCTSLTTAPELPATTLAEYCYGYMFVGCTSLENAPVLPATTLASSCYNCMFNRCTSLTTAPVLSATTLASSCYAYMFQGCTSLENAPVLPATTLASSCYAYMFQGCTSLVNAPVLPATTLADNCYQYMFQNCTSLTTAPELPATTLANYCYYNMFNGCTSLTTAPELNATTLADNCYYYMFNGCTSLENAPVLPATTLASSCYNCMFKGCTSLVSAPELPATTLVSSCYSSMFKGCTSLNYIKAMFTTTPSDAYTKNWVQYMSDNGTFVKNKNATWNVTGDNGVPTGWTIETATA